LHKPLDYKLLENQSKEKKQQGHCS